MKITLKVATVLGIICLMLMMNFLVFLNSVKATNIGNISQVDLRSLGNCGQLLKYKGVIVKTYYVEYSHDGASYPAYCLDKNLAGVSDDLTYSVTSNGVINDVGLWRTIINGYPYKSIYELGVSNKEEAFTATKQAIYCYLFENTPEDYEAIGEAGQRTLNALNQIVFNANDSTETQLTNTVSIKPISSEWLQDKEKPEYVSKIYAFNSNVSHTDYKIELQGNCPEGAIVTNVEGIEETHFQGDSNFKVMFPIAELKNNGDFTINVRTEVKTKPVLYGASPNSGWQNYALTAYMYEDAICKYEDGYNKNETKIKIKKQDASTKEPISGVEFELLNEKQEIVYSNLKTDGNGEVVIDMIMPGTYFVRETMVPEGYKIYKELIKVEAELNKEVTVIVDNKKVEIIEVPKELKVLPVTGM